MTDELFGIVPMKRYFDILNLPELTGIIFLQSVVSPIQQSSLRHYKKICALIRDKQKKSIFFPNEFNRFTTVDLRNQSVQPHQLKARQAFSAASWYYDHLGGQKPIVMVTEDDEVIKDMSSLRIEIFVLTLGKPETSNMRLGLCY